MTKDTFIGEVAKFIHVVSEIYLHRLMSNESEHMYTYTVRAINLVYNHCSMYVGDEMLLVCASVCACACVCVRVYCMCVLCVYCVCVRFCCICAHLCLSVCLSVLVTNTELISIINITVYKLSLYTCGSELFQLEL